MIQRFARGNEVQKLRPAFTLVELLVVISIIGLLIAIALPAFSSAKKRAKSVASQSTINSIESGLEVYRAESALGGAYPPSHSDMEEGSGDAGRIASPVHKKNLLSVRITGASLLVYALGGPDDLGTAGFRDLDGDGYWADDTSAQTGAEGLYDETTNEPRYGPYIGASLMEEIAEVRRVDEDTGIVTGLTQEHVIQYSDSRYSWYGSGANHGKYRTEMNDAEAAQRFFVDKFRRPILYYKARKHAKVMVQTPGGTALPGTFDHRDNSLFTGGLAPGNLTNGVWLRGAGFASQASYYDRGNPANTRMHDISITYYPSNNYFGRLDASGSSSLDGVRRFDNFIVRKSSRGTPKAVNSDTYLLISAGPDGIYGSEDDVTNWSR